MGGEPPDDRLLEEPRAEARGRSLCLWDDDHQRRLPRAPGDGLGLRQRKALFSLSKNPSSWLVRLVVRLLGEPLEQAALFVGQRGAASPR